MHYIFHLIQNLFTFPDFFIWLMFACFIYFGLIGPILFHCWIIPKLQKRLHGKIKIDSSSYFVNFPSWGMPALEISLYIFLKYYGWNPRGYKNPRNGTYPYALKNLNYDIKDSSRAEIILAIFTIFLAMSMIISVILLFIYFQTHPHHP